MPLADPLRAWLLDGTDASVRYRVLRELLDRHVDDPDLIAARLQIGANGWAADLLALQHPDGHWATPGTSSREMERPLYVSTRYFLMVLADLGIARNDPRMLRGLDLYFDRMSRPEFHELGGKDSEPCFTAIDIGLAYRFGRGDDPRIQRALAWLLAEQKDDGGWNCQPSETGTLDTFEPLQALATIDEPHRSAEVRRAIDRGLEFYLARALMDEGEPRYAPWGRTHYPVHYFYDFLVGLDTVTSLRKGRDPRLRRAWEWLEGKRNADGSWNLDALHPDRDDAAVRAPRRDPFFSLGLEFPGRPSRWITTTALIVLRRAGRS